MFSYMKRGPKFYREVVCLAVPIIIQNLITNSLSLLDTFMVGLLGEGPMAAVTLANIPVFVINLLIFGLQSGSSVLISQYYGKGDSESINRVMGIGLTAAFLITALLGCVMCFFPVQFMGLFGNEPEVVTLAARYTRVVAFSFLFDSLALVYVAVHRAMGNPKLGMYILAASMITNTVLNWMFIFGNLGAPRLGIEGAALATLISRIVEFVIALGHLLFSKRFRVQPAALFHPGVDMLRRYIRYSSPVIFNETMWGLGTGLYPTVMGHMANSQPILAAYGVAGSIERVAIVFVFGLSATASIIIGRDIGAGKETSEVEKTGLALATVSFCSGLVVGIGFLFITWFFTRPILYPMFQLTPEAAAIATWMSVVVFTTLSFRSFNSVNTVGVFRGGGDVRMASLIDLGPLWFAALPFATITGLVLKQSIYVVYLCIAVENLVKFSFSQYRLRSGRWIKDVTKE